MRKLSLFIFVMIAMAASAQTSGGEVIRKPKVGNNKEQSSSPSKNIRIGRFINGISLGKSTKQDVIKLLNNNGREYKVYETNDESTVIISNGNIHYYGVTWEAVAYKLYQNTVYQISFLKGGDNGNESSNVIYFVKLRDYFISIYGNYHKSLPEGEHFTDKITYLFVVGGDANHRKDLSLHFADVRVYDMLLSK